MDTYDAWELDDMIANIGGNDRLITLNRQHPRGAVD